MDSIERKTTETLERIVRRIDELEGRLNWQKDKTARLNTVLDEVLSKLSKLEALQAQLSPDPQEEKRQKKIINLDQILETLRYYSNVAEITGQIVQILAGAVILIIDSIRKKKAEANQPGKNAGQSGELDLTDLLQAANGLFRGLMASDADRNSSKGEASPKTQ